jgi:hypothetical protein
MIWVFCSFAMVALFPPRSILCSILYNEQTYTNGITYFIIMPIIKIFFISYPLRSLRLCEKINPFIPTLRDK